MKQSKNVPRFTKTGMLVYFLKGSLGLFAVSILCNLFMTFLQGSLGLFAVSILCNLFMTFLLVLIPQLIGFTVDSVIGTEEVSSSYEIFVRIFGGIERLKENIWLIALVVVALSLVTALFRYGNNFFTLHANQIMLKRMRDTLFSHLQRLPLSWHHTHNTGDIIQRCTSDVDAISNFVSGQLVHHDRLPARRRGVFGGVLCKTSPRISEVRRRGGRSFHHRTGKFHGRARRARVRQRKGGAR